MLDTEFDDFAELLDAVCSLLSRGTYLPDSTNTALFFRSLRAHSLPAVRAAFDAHISDSQRGRFVPVPADILAQLRADADDDGRPGPEEAWATAITAADEGATVVWTAETAAAWSIAKRVLDLGDEVGARMAFREAYARLVAESRAIRLAPQWVPSLGHDAARRELALTQAVATGRLPAPQVAGLLPAPTLPAKSMPPQVMEMLRGLRDRMLAQIESVSQDAAAKEATAIAKAEAQRKFDEYERGK